MKSKPRVLQMVPKPQPQTEPETTSAGAEALLLDLLEAIQSGAFNPRMMVVHCASDAPEHGLTHQYWAWNLRPIEHLGLLDMARYSVLSEGAR